MNLPRVVVTGIGLVSSLGLETKEHFCKLLKGKSGITSLTRPEFIHFPSRLQAGVEDFDKRGMISHRMLRKLLSPSASFAVIAAGQAIRDSGLEGNGELLKNCGLYIGSLSLDVKPDIFIPALRESLGEDGQFNIARFAARGTKLLDPLFLVKLLPNGGLCGIAIEHQINGPNCNITNGTVSGMQAVIYAASAIQRGETDLAIAGGYDSLLHIDSIIENHIVNRLSKRNDQPEKACRPFDSTRDGYVLGEGAALVMLESESHARSRSARIYGVILGSGQSTDNDVFLGKKPGNGSELEHASRCALRQGQCDLSELDVIFGDGLATESDDLIEANVYKRLVSNNGVLMTAATGSLGFIGAASGTFSLAHALGGMYQGFIPPLINCESPDARCDLPFVHVTQYRHFNRALIWNSDRGLKNAAILVGAYDE